MKQSTAKPQGSREKGPDSVEEGLFRAIFDSVPVGVAVTTRDRRFRKVNRKLCEILDYEPQDLLGKTFVDVTHPDDIEKSISESDRAYDQDFSGGKFSKRYLTRSGDVVWAQVTVHTVRQDDDSSYVVALIEDVTEQRCQEELARSLASHSDRLAGIIKQSPFFTIFATADGAITYLNNAALEMLGFADSASAIGQSLDLFDFCEASGESTPLLEAVRENKTYQGERTFRTATGDQRIEVEVSAFEIASPRAGEPTGVAVIARDISLRRQYERRIRANERRLRRLTRQLLKAQEEERARIARELHDDITQQLSLLAVDIGFLQAEPVSDPDELQTKLQDLQDQAAALAENVRRLSHQYHPSVLSHADLRAALEMLCEEAKALIDIDINYIPRIEAAELSREKSIVVFRIVQEALRNVAKHADAKSASVILDRQGKEILVVVVDDGKGFDSEADRNRQGLGLVSMLERAQLIGGSINIVSAPNEGSRIELRIPRSDA